MPRERIRLDRRLFLLLFSTRGFDIWPRLLFLPRCFVMTSSSSCATAVPTGDTKVGNPGLPINAVVSTAMGMRRSWFIYPPSLFNEPRFFFVLIWDREHLTGSTTRQDFGISNNPQEVRLEGFPLLVEEAPRYAPPRQYGNHEKNAPFSFGLWGG